MRTLVAICTVFAAAAACGEIKFTPINVKGVGLVSGVTHPEFRTATNQLWGAVSNIPNIADNRITNSVLVGYLCTVEAAQAMTNGVMTAADGKFVLQGTNNQPRVTIENAGVYVSEQGAGGGFVRTFRLGPETDGFGCLFSMLTADPFYMYIGRFYATTNGYAFSTAYQDDSTSRDRKSTLTPDDTPVLTANLATNIFPIVTNAYTKAEADGRFMTKSGTNSVYDGWKIKDGNDEDIIKLDQGFWNFYGMCRKICDDTFGHLLYFLDNEAVLIDKNHTSQEPIATMPDITRSITDKIDAQAATNAAEAVVGEVMEYGLTNLTANTETFALASGVIGNLALDSAHTNINLTLLYPASTAKSADILLRVINAAETALAINSDDTDVDGTDWTKVKAGTNYVSATRTAYEGGRSKVLVNVKGL